MKKLRRIVNRVILIILIVLGVQMGIGDHGKRMVQEIMADIAAKSVKPERDTVDGSLSTASYSSLKARDIKSSYAMLMGLNHQEVLFEKNSTDIMYPASLTKIMTALVAIETIPDLNAIIEITNQAFDGLYEEGASLAGFAPGEQVRAIDLLYGLMLPSGAECSKALALESAGGVEAFVDLMNAKAEELGMSQTHFENTTGLHAPNHCTTIQDLSILLKTALNNEVFRKVYTTAQYVTPGDNKFSEGLTLDSTFLGRNNIIQIQNGEIIGGKTGYTKEAGLCLSSLAVINDEEYIFISTGAQGDHYTEPYNIMDAVKAYNSIQSKE